LAAFNHPNVPPEGCWRRLLNHSAKRASPEASSTSFQYLLPVPPSSTSFQYLDGVAADARRLLPVTSILVEGGESLVTEGSGMPEVYGGAAVFLEGE
jgi:hypothetical protein